MHFPRLILIAFALGAQAAPISDDSNHITLAKRFSMNGRREYLQESSEYPSRDRPTYTSEEDFIKGFIKKLLSQFLKSGK
jgi:hypothetical protein